MPAPHTIPNYEEKFEYLTTRRNGAGVECLIAINGFNIHGVRVNELHHAGIHNTKVNRKIYPDVVHSPFNLMPVNHEYHMIRSSYGRKPGLWAEKLQKFLMNPIHWKCKMVAHTCHWPTNENTNT